MKNLIYSFAALLMFPVLATAQSTPLYKCDTLPPPNSTKSGTPMLLAARDIRGGQMIHYQTDFPGMPAQGIITDVYIQIGKMTPAGAKLPGLLIKLGATSKMAYSQNIGGTVQHPNLDTFYYNSMFVLQDTLWANDWLNLPLQTPYGYSFVSSGDSARNLVVEIVHDSLPLRHIQEEAFSPNFLSYYTTNYSVNSNRRCIQINHDGTTNGAAPAINVIGFNPKPDPPPLGVNSVRQEKVVVYPNPVKEKLYVKGILRQENYSITEITGKVLINGKLDRDVIDVSMLSSGLYFLRIGHQTIRFLKE